MEIIKNNALKENILDIKIDSSTNLSTLVSTILLATHPVGSLYWSSDSTDPGTLFGGTWTQITDRFLYCVGSDAGTTGGSSSHTHTTGGHALIVSEIPSHNHSFTGTKAEGKLSLRGIEGGGGDWSSCWSATGVFKTDGRESSNGYGSASSDGAFAPYKIAFSMTPSGSIGNTGSGNSHNHGDTGSASNLPPYLKVYCWRRTA